MTTQQATRKIEYGSIFYFGMYTDEGNWMVFKELSKILSRTNLHGTVKRNELLGEIRKMESLLEDAGHGEVSDTEVRIHVSRWLNTNVNQPNGWVQLDYFYENL